jgi:CubicO group peptidase (beta-lactamase class C family)
MRTPDTASRRIDRRGFLQTTGTALTLSLIGAACGRDTRQDSGAEPPRVDDELSAYLDRMMPELMAEAFVPGGALVLIRDTQVAWRRTFGVANADTRTPVDHDSIFEAGSMSKPVFAYVVLKLCETGVLDLDRPLVGYTNEQVVPGDARSDRLTARHVLSHTSGLPNWRSSDTPMAFAFEPGARYGYSGEGYSYLQAVVSRLQGRADPAVCGTYEQDLRVCGTDFGEYMTRRLLTPFGMASGAYVWSEALAAHLATAHDAEGRVMAKGRTSTADAARYGAAGGLFVTPTDYARFLIEVMVPRKADEFHVTPEQVATMVTPVVKAGDAPPHSWALGWQVLELDWGNVVAHGGSNPGFQAYSAISIPRRTGMVFMTNGDNGYRVISGIIANGALRRMLAA